MSRADDIQRILDGLHAAAAAVQPFTAGDIDFQTKELRDDPVTAADEAADRVLREILPQAGEGWLSEESVDDPARLGCARVWVVDPIDGTREFIQGIPEWCISIGLVEDGVPVAGGIFNPASDELVLGSLEDGVTLNGSPVRVTEPALGASRAGPGGEARIGVPSISVLASRSEIRRGEWDHFEGPSADGVRFDVRPCGSVAYKLGLVAAGRADATWTLVGKSEWDVVAGTALVRAAGGAVSLRDGTPPAFNQPRPVYPNYLAAGQNVARATAEGWLRCGRGDGRR